MLALLRWVGHGGSAGGCGGHGVSGGIADGSRAQFPCFSVDMFVVLAIRGVAVARSVSRVCSSVCVLFCWGCLCEDGTLVARC